MQIETLSLKEGGGGGVANLGGYFVFCERDFAQSPELSTFTHTHEHLIQLDSLSFIKKDRLVLSYEFLLRWWLNMEKLDNVNPKRSLKPDSS